LGGKRGRREDELVFIGMRRRTLVWSRGLWKSCRGVTRGLAHDSRQSETASFPIIPPHCHTRRACHEPLISQDQQIQTRWRSAAQIQTRLRLQEIQSPAESVPRSAEISPSPQPLPRASSKSQTQPVSAPLLPKASGDRDRDDEKERMELLLGKGLEQ
jgi:hypothetical protein